MPYVLDSMTLYFPPKNYAELTADERKAAYEQINKPFKNPKDDRYTDTSKCIRLLNLVTRQLRNTFDNPGTHMKAKRDHGFEQKLHSVILDIDAIQSSLESLSKFDQKTQAYTGSISDLIQYNIRTKERTTGGKLDETQGVPDEQRTSAADGKVDQSKVQASDVQLALLSAIERISSRLDNIEREHQSSKRLGSDEREIIKQDLKRNIEQRQNDDADFDPLAMLAAMG